MNTYPITNDYRRGCYVAVITGQPHPKFKFGRDFVTGTPIKSRRILTYTAEMVDAPSWLIVQDTRARRIVAATGIGWTDHGPIEPDDVLEVVAGGLPDDPGAWVGDRCGACASPNVDGRCLANCEKKAAEMDRIEAAQATQPDTEPF